MKLAFTGDICLGDMERFTDDPFGNIIPELAQYNIVVNLEAIFLPPSYTDYPMKPKLCLRQNDETIEHVKQLNPFLVNLSNNHINDYGNFGATNTMKQLEAAGLSHFGAGLAEQDHNVFVLESEKVVFLSYTTRSTDQTGCTLFNEVDLIGPKELSLELVRTQSAGYDDYTKIVLFHWGVEDAHYPLPEQREMARSLIDMGIDLIVGNHPHVVQSYEQYRGKWIFYCLGHFFFPDFMSHYVKDGQVQTYADIHPKARKTTIVPVLAVGDDGVVLERVHTVMVNERFEPRVVDRTVRYNRFLFEDAQLYEAFYKSRRAYEKAKYLMGSPGRMKRKILGVGRPKSSVSTFTQDLTPR